MEDFGASIVGIILFIMGAFMFYLMFFLMPVAFYTDAECLRNGYPRSEVTIGLERYCLSLDGAVTVKVDKAGKATK